MSAPTSPGARILLDIPAVQLVLDGTGAVSMFVVLGAIAGNREAALVTAALTALVLTSRFRRRAAATRPRYITRSAAEPTHTSATHTAHLPRTGQADHDRTDRPAMDRRGHHPRSADGGCTPRCEHFVRGAKAATSAPQDL
ncbi:hypothetical protein ACFULT_22580 [Rhodococcus sp. NPDC057297]|uniref:hypothetical protein n=1 Tax=Rhodococcus sp. NPDC057297 TaxID=3346090 RepID=UPI00362FE873